MDDAALGSAAVASAAAADDDDDDASGPPLPSDVLIVPPETNLLDIAHALRPWSDIHPPINFLGQLGVE